MFRVVQEHAGAQARAIQITMKDNLIIVQRKNNKTAFFFWRTENRALFRVSDGHEWQNTVIEVFVNPANSQSIY